jgi:hypothetical protein
MRTASYFRRSGFVIILFSCFFCHAQDKPSDADVQKQIDLRKSAAEAQKTEADARAQEIANKKSEVEIDQNATKAKADMAKAAADLKAAELTNEKSAIEAAQAEKDSETKNIPKPTLSLPDGTISLTDQGKLVESELLAYRAGAEIAQMIADRLAESSCKDGVTIFRDDDLTVIQAYRGFLSQITLLSETMANQIKSSDDLTNQTYQQVTSNQRLAPFGLAEGLSLAEGTAKTAAEIVGMFQSKSQLYGVQVSLKQEAVEAEVSYALLKAKPVIAVKNPHMFSTGFVDFSKPSPFIQKIGTLDKTADSQRRIILLAQKTAEFRTAANKEPDAATKAAANAAVDDYEARAKAASAALSAAIDSFSKIRSALYYGTTDKPSLGSDSPFLAILKAEAIGSSLESATCLLEVSAASMGGAILTQQNLWTFFGTPRIYHAGGLAISYVAFLHDGSVISAGTLPLMGEYVKSASVRKTLMRALETQKHKKHDR